MQAIRIHDFAAPLDGNASLEHLATAPDARDIPCVRAGYMDGVVAG